jgi:hypothetical protein
MPTCLFPYALCYIIDPVDQITLNRYVRGHIARDIFSQPLRQIHFPDLPTSTSPLQRQKTKVRANNRSRRKRQAGKPTIALGIIQIRQRAIRRRLVDPATDAVQDFLAHGGLGDGRGFEFPVRLGVEVARVEGQAVLLHYDGVVRRLIGVDVVRDEIVRRG